MLLDIKTTIIFSTAMITFIALALLYYRFSQKTYPGFDYWIGGTLLVSLGYNILFFRDWMPLWLNVLLINLLFGFGAVLKWDGSTRFVSARRLHRIHYATPFPFIAVIAYFLFIKDDLVLRGLVFGLFICFYSMVNAKEFRRSNPVIAVAMFKVTALLFFGYGMAVLGRSLLWLLFPSSSIFNAGNAHAVYFIFFTLFELSIGISYLMMNNQALESELHQSKNSLHDSIQELEKALSEIKTLSGLLPICASCKKIRDDNGYWNQIESYIENHSQALFSHGICPECAEKLYKDAKWFQKLKNK